MQEADEVLEQAETMSRSGRLQEAIDLLTAAVAMDPTALLVQVRLADCLRRSGRSDEAFVLYRDAALGYADRGSLPFAVALYKLMTPLIPELDPGSDGGRPLLRELVQRLMRHREGLEPEEVPARTPIPLLEDLAREELEDVIRNISPLRTAAGTLIFKEGDEGASLFILTKGTVRIFSVSREGQRVDLATLGPGEFFGEWSIISGEYRRHTWVEAETDVEMLELSGEMIDQVSHRHPQVRETLEAYYRRRRLDTLIARVFPALPAAERRKMAERLGDEVRYIRGTVIFREGDTTGFMSIIKQGTVEVYTTNFDGVKLTLALLGPGQYFGEGAALSGTPRTASIRARTDVIVHHISREDLVTSLARHPALLEGLQGVRAERVEETLEKLAEGGRS